MKTYAQIQAEIAKLQKHADAARKGEIAGVVKRIKEAIAEYEPDRAGPRILTRQGSDQGNHERTAKARKNGKPTTVGVAKYRDPATGKTWTGRGKPPDWIKGAKNRDQFLISAAKLVATRD
jgi:DNA-binding protein H-NS